MHFRRAQRERLSCGVSRETPLSPLSELVTGFFSFLSSFFSFLVITIARGIRTACTLLRERKKERRGERRGRAAKETTALLFDL